MMLLADQQLREGENVAFWPPGPYRYRAFQNCGKKTGSADLFCQNHPP